MGQADIKEPPRIKKAPTPLRKSSRLQKIHHIQRGVLQPPPPPDLTPDEKQPHQQVTPSSPPQKRKRQRQQSKGPGEEQSARQVQGREGPARKRQRPPCASTNPGDQGPTTPTSLPTVPPSSRTGLQQAAGQENTSNKRAT
ncbi:MAG: hypothetical protein Q9169_005827 [Polycauliona sp. 2 TL-2023]